MNKAVVKKNIAIFFLTLMCVQYIPIEGDGASYVKFAAMCLTPLIWLNMFKTFSKVFILGGIYLIAIVFSVLYNSDSFRLSTVGYKIAFVVMFIMYYDLIYFNRALTIHDLMMGTPNALDCVPNNPNIQPWSFTGFRSYCCTARTAYCLHQYVQLVGNSMAMRAPTCAAS